MHRTATNLIAAASGSPVSLADVKLHLRITDTSQDALLNAYIASATETVQKEGGGRSFYAETWQDTYDHFPPHNHDLFLYRSPVQSVTSLTYYDGSNTLQTLVQGTDFNVLLPTNHQALLYPINFWPFTYKRPDAVLVTYVAAWSPVPNIAVQAIKHMVSYWHENPGDDATNEIPPGVERLLTILRGTT